MRLSFLALPILLALGGCAGSPGKGSYALIKGDARPHPAVSHAQAYAIHGIDVSKWQGDIDWGAARAGGTTFAFIKATEGGDHVDDRFQANWNGAKAAGVVPGAYHFVYWCRPAREQAVWFRQHIPVDPDALPPVLDVEWNAFSRTCPKRISSEDAREKIAIMLKELEIHTGKRPIIYTDIAFHRDVLEGYFDDYPFWLRSTAADPGDKYPNRRWSLWQYTTTGRMPGIRGDVDRNTFNGSPKEWQAFLQPAGQSVEIARARQDVIEQEAEQQAAVE